jgi:hypothetical protein
MEGMVANCIRDYGGTNLRQFGDCSCMWKNLPEWVSCILVAIWRL